MKKNLMRERDKLETAWAAGLFEAKGCIYHSPLGKRKFDFAVSARNVQTIEEYAIITGGKTYTKRNKKRGDLTACRFQHHDRIAPLVKDFYKFVDSKRENFDLFLYLWDEKPPADLSVSKEEKDFYLAGKSGIPFSEVS